MDDANFRDRTPGWETSTLNREVYWRFFGEFIGDATAIVCRGAGRNLRSRLRHLVPPGAHPNRLEMEESDDSDRYVCQWYGSGNCGVDDLPRCACSSQSACAAGCSAAESCLGRLPHPRLNCIAVKQERPVSSRSSIGPGRNLASFPHFIPVNI